MKKKYTFIFVLVFSLVLTACGNDVKDENQVNEKPVSIENEDRTEVNTETSTPEAPSESIDQNTNEASEVDMLEKMDELDYAEFEMEVEYANDQEYEVELERKSNDSIKSKIKDSLNNVEKKGVDALNELYPLVRQLTITQETSKDDAIQEILAIFSLPADYEELELEIEFHDGTKLKYKDEK